MPAADINIAALAAKCSGCQSAFTFAPPSRVRAVPPMPANVTVTGTPTLRAIVSDYRSYASAVPPLTIRYRQFSIAGVVFNTIFVVLWFGVLSQAYLSFRGQPLWIYFLPIFHVLAGLVVVKQILEALFNADVFDMTGERLVATRGPIRWPWQRGRVELPVAELRQLSVLEKVGTRNRTSYGVIAHLKNGTTVALVDDLPHQEVATFIERSIEEQLGLPDEPWLNQSV
ncbi:MAG: hypothetical protein KF837_15340 [Labilithrix sp.]|nr:hypothetical protein [Labilithrix sp.]